MTTRAVLSTATDLFAKYGYRGASLELVASQLGVTRQALYYHFESKDAILGALFEQVMVQHELCIARCSNAAPGARFGELLRAHIQTTVASPSLVVVLLNERPEISKINGLRADARRREYVRSVIEAFEEGVKAGTLRSDIHPVVAVNSSLIASNSVGLWYRPEGGLMGPEEAAQQLFEMSMKGLIAG